MIRTSFGALMIAAVTTAFLALPADAAARKKTTVAPAGSQRTVYTYRDESGRRRTVIIVQKRSYLDPGTWVLPGQRKYSDYATQPFSSPTDVLGPGRGAYERNPIGPRWEFGGANY